MWYQVKKNNMPSVDLKQGVKWEDNSKKEEKEDILLEKEDKKRTFFSLNLIQQK